MEHGADILGNGARCRVHQLLPKASKNPDILYQGSRTNVMRAHAAVYLMEQLLAFGC
jgi:hypothetical protein